MCCTYTLWNYEIKYNPISFQYLWSYFAQIIRACSCKRKKCFYNLSSKCKLFCWFNLIILTNNIISHFSQYNQIQIMYEYYLVSFWKLMCFYFSMLAFTIKLYLVSCGHVSVLHVFCYQHILFPFSGCCDGNPADDLRLPNGTVVRDVEDIPMFLHGWMVDTSEDTDYFRRVGDNCTTGNCSKCFTMLNQRPFSKCHPKVLHTQAWAWATHLHPLLLI